MLSLLDTDILSEVLKKKNPAVVRNAAAYLQAHQQFIFSAITRYEVVRGLKDRNASNPLKKFAAFCQHSRVLAINDAILDLAADLWVAARRKGLPNRDADLMIAATAIVNGYTLVTGNTRHFSWMSGLPLVDWRQP